VRYPRATGFCAKSGAAVTRVRMMTDNDVRIALYIT
jgi:hypothetical protein